jgi:cobalt transporter subunit CbtA
MIMLTRMLAAGLLAGVLAGILVSGLQHFTTVPMILKAETYEKAGAKPASSAAVLLRDQTAARLILIHGDEDHSADGTSAAAKAWSPADGLQRTLATSVTTIGMTVGFALMLLAAMIATETKITPRTALLWGAAGFFATGLATAFGLPPELPGAAAGDLVHRQIWWAATALATAVGIWLLLKSETQWLWVGLLLIAAPHIIGAPHAPAFASAVPAELSAQFTSASLAVHAVLWTLTGALTGYFWNLVKGPATLEV